MAVTARVWLTLWFFLVGALLPTKSFAPGPLSSYMCSTCAQDSASFSPPKQTKRWVFVCHTDKATHQSQSIVRREIAIPICHTSLPSKMVSNGYLAPVVLAKMAS